MIRPQIAIADAIQLTETRIVEMALQKNLGVKSVEAENEIEKTNIGLAKSVFDTTGKFDIDYTIDKRDWAIPLFGTNNRITNFNLGVSRELPSGTEVSVDWTNQKQSTNSAFATVNPYYESAASVSISQPLLKNIFGRQDRGQVSLAKKIYESANALSKRKVLESVHNVLFDYWSWVTHAANVEVVRQSVEEARRFEKISGERESLGLFESTDVLASRAGRLQVENALAESEVNLENSKGKLVSDLDLEAGSAMASSEKIPFPEKILEREEALIFALKNRPDYQAVRRLAEAKNIELTLAKNRRWPELDLVASLRLNGVEGSYGSSLSEISRGSHPTYMVGGKIEWPLEGRQSRSEARRALWEKRKALYDLKEMENVVIREVGEQLRGAGLWHRQVLANREIEKLNRKRWLVELEKYKTGRSGSDFVIRYHEDYLESRRAMLASLLQYRMAVLGLRLAQGNLIDDFVEKGAP